MLGVRSGLAVAVLLVASAVSAAEEAVDVVILSPYRSQVGANARPRLLPHAGVDFAAPVGTPVLAAADGVVSLLIDYEPGCGVGVVLSHPRFKRWTAYCHLTRAVVATGQAVARGERIGFSGASGNAAGVPHVHLELCTTACASHRDGDLRNTQDPLGLVVGCHDPQRGYPADRFALTLPIECRQWTKDARR
ncbi:MAG: M23 family metallopeptidase [Candidatus Rokuibacteriota bacterium]|jgi:murein DD-endopeptidase MepM/ murein hydrolase activator NlpD